MASRSSVIPLKRQQGLAFLVLMIIIILAIISYSFSDLSVSQVKVNRDKNTQINLKKAKQALIDYAVTYSDRAAGNVYGVLPNPEANISVNDGNQTPTIGSKDTNIVEWFPWRSLDMPNLKDDSGNCLFYAVSGTYRSSPRADMINEDSYGMFRVRNSADQFVQGGTVDDQPVALVIAPGAPLTGQTRAPSVVNSSCGRDYGNVSAYLEGNGVYDNSTLSAVADEVDDFIHATDSSSTEAIPHNDRFLTISRDEIWNAIIKRSDFKQKMENLTQALAMCLAGYANVDTNSGRRLPWPARTDLGFGTYDRKNYRLNVNYADDNGATQGYSGRFPFDIANSNNAIWPVAVPAGVEANLFNIIDPDIMPTNPDPAIPPQPQLCGNLVLTSGPDTGTAIDLYSTASAYRKLWNNWKDHFFYVLSKEYEPDNVAVGKCGGSAPCIKVNEIEYAAAVIFSGSRLSGVTRNDKTDVAEYLEGGKVAEFISEVSGKTGNRAYAYTDPQTETENDIMYCIENKSILTDDLTVIECS